MTDAGELDLGQGVTVQWTAWGPHDRVGIIRHHQAPSGELCTSSALFDLPGVREAFPGHAVWTVQSLDPLDVSPSLLCRTCGDHGWIRGGRWVPA